jgi:hypothetical protein
MMLGWRSITGALTEAGTLVSAGLPVLLPKEAFHLVVRSKRGSQATETFAKWLVAHARAEYGSRSHAAAMG